VVGDLDVSSRLALTTHELLENATKYSVDGAAHLFVQVDIPAGIVEVRVRNRSTAAQIQRVRGSFDEIAAASDSGTLYATMMRRTAVLESGSGGLGLARIWAESEMTIRLTVTGDQVEIQAVGPASLKS
jgi:hypothetical protein